jgi:hypothetical protein
MLGVSAERGNGTVNTIGQSPAIEANLPAGEEIEFQAWHERAFGAQAAFEAKKDWPKGRFKLKLKVGETKDLGTIAVSARAFR